MTDTPDICERVIEDFADALTDVLFGELGPNRYEAAAKEAFERSGLTAHIARLTSALTDAREAIASLAEDTFGEVILEYDDNGYPVCGYPVRDELLSKIDATLEALRSEKGGM